MNNAGTSIRNQFKNKTLDQLTEVFNVNVKSVVFLTRFLLPQLESRDSRCGIINVGSITSYFPFPGSTDYAASKRFINLWSRALHVEVKNTDVLLVSPGYVTTKLINNKTGIDCTTPAETAAGSLRDLGHEIDTNATLRHEIFYAWIMRVLYNWLPLEKFLAILYKSNPVKKLD